MKRPRSVRVFGREFELSFRLRRNMPPKHDGQMLRQKLQILVNSQQCEFDLKDTALHEVMHAILAESHFERTSEMEEYHVLALASGLMAVLQDNPHFAQWLIEPIKPRK